MAGQIGTTFRKKRRAWVFILVISDAVMMAVSLRLAFFLRFEGKFFLFEPYALTSAEFYTQLVYLFIPLLLAIFFFYKLYDWDYLLGGSGEYTRVVSAITMGLFAVVIVSFMAKAPTIARGWLLLAWLTTCTSIIMARLLMRKIIYWQRERGTFLSRVLIVGANEEGKTIAEQILKAPRAGLKLIGFADDCLQPLEPVISNIGVVGKTSELSALIKNYRVESIIFASSAFSHHQLVKLLQMLRGHNLDIRLSSGLFEILLSRVMIKELCGIPLVGIKSVSLSTSDLILKTAFDFAVALLTLFILAPVLLLIAILIKITSPGPILYVQKRAGKNGQVFNFYKFRTMHQDADKMLDGLREHNEADGAIFKIRNDPRITKVGKFLRKFSLDELPQLFNVLKGEMSLVGPRPPIPDEIKNYDGWHLKRLDVIPGITGLWQISGRSNLSFDEMVKLDLFYIENWSLTFDIKILLRTIGAVVSGAGAY